MDSGHPLPPSNSKFTYTATDVCVVGMGCVLPDADNVSDFWENLVKGHCAIGTISKERWNTDAYYCHEATEDLSKSKSQSACLVSEKSIQQIAKDLGLSRENRSRLNLMTHAACQQALAQFGEDELANKKVDVLLGCMAADESFGQLWKQREIHQLTKIAPQFSSSFDSLNPPYQNQQAERDIFFSSSILRDLKAHFNLTGEAMLLDSACASSLTAIDHALASLKQGTCDMAITGGIEGDLGAATFSLFSAVGALSKYRSLPFDQNSDGLMQGEGAVAFVLQRLEDAVTQGREIFAVLKGCGASSDGRQSSLFSPSKSGQILAYQRAYQQAGNTPPDFIECHGTGTEIGDTTELASLAAFFAKNKITIGSCKANIGHTKGAAGAAGLLKALQIIQHKSIPASGHIKKNRNSASNICINQELVNLEPSSSSHNGIRCAVSAFGFGNINYHLVVDEFTTDSSIKICVPKPPLDDIVICGSHCINHLSKEDLNLLHSLPILPASMPQTDDLQLKAVILVAQLLKHSGIHQEQLDPMNTGVISASVLALPKAIEFVTHVAYNELIHATTNKTTQALLLQQRKRFTEITPDTGPGILNNVISARIVNAFNFNGPNYNVDCDALSLPAALELARRELHKNSNMIFVVSSEDIPIETPDGLIIKREGLTGFLLTRKSIALEKRLPIQSVLTSVDFYDRVSSCNIVEKIA